MLKKKQVHVSKFNFNLERVLFKREAEHTSPLLIQ